MQLNYEYLRKCVASGPVTPMLPSMWERVLSLVPRPYLTHPLSKPLIPQLHNEISTSYEETIRKTTSK